MDFTRRRFLELSAMTVGAAGATSTLTRAPSARADILSWILPQNSYTSLTDTSLGGDPGVVSSTFNQGTTFFPVKYSGPQTPNPVPDGYRGIGTLKFTAYQNGSNGLIDAIGAGLPEWARAAQYDSESWSQTPAIEQGAWLFNSNVGVSYAELFCRLAHEHGLHVVLSPGNDLCNNKPNSAYPDSAPQYPLNSGEKNYQAYLRYDLASAAQWLWPGDVYEYMAQVIELDTGTYQSVTSAVAERVGGVSRHVRVLAGIGRTGDTWDGATADQLTAAAQSVAGVADGFWPNVDADPTRVQTMIAFLRDLGF
jgi:hypothetical protein